MSDTEMLDARRLGDDDPEPSDEGEGDNINPASEDSSEEAPTDEEEAANIRKGFIVDDDDDEDSGEEDEDSRQKKRRKRRRKRGLSLEADDLDLVAENTGRKVSSRPELSRIRRGRASPTPLTRPARTANPLSDSDDDEEPGDINDIFNDARARREQRRNNAANALDEQLDVDNDMMDMDDMDAFIDDDDDDEAAEMGEEERAQRRAEKRRSEAQRRKAMDARPELAGIDASAWDEIYDVFGAGDEYDWALDAEDDDGGSDHELSQKEMRYQDVFEPAEIAARFLTADDDVIRATDVPERMQLTTSSLSPHATLSPTLISSPPFPDTQITPAVEWIAPRLGQRIQAEFFVAGSQHMSLLEHLVSALTSVVKYILQQYLEVPYIWTHRRDHISHFTPGTSRVQFFDRDDLWRIHTLCLRYRALWMRREVLDKTYERMSMGGGVDDRYYEIEVRPSLGSVEGVSDALDWLSVKYKKAYTDAVEFGDDYDAAGAGGEGGSQGRQQKRPNRMTPYDFAKNSVLSQLANAFGIEPGDMVQNAIANKKNIFTEDQPVTPLIYAESFINTGSTNNPNVGGPSSPEEALATARMIYATELGKDPLLRQLVRERYRNGAVVSVRPTEKGINKIDDQHPYAAFKYLQSKPVSRFLNDTQWLHLLAAEADHLVSIEISLSPPEEASFRDTLTRAFNADGYSDTAKAWNHQRAQVIEEVMDKFLYAVGVKFVREWLKDEVEESLANRCSAVLEHRIDVAAYRPREFEKGEPPAVLALSWGKGDPQKDAIYAVFIDEAGHLREQTKFDNLMDPDLRTEFLDLMKRRKPDVVAVGGFSILSTKLMERVKEVIGYNNHKSEEDGARNPHDDDDDQDKEKNLVPVIWVPDQVARLYQHSRRASEEFAALPVIGRYCAGLARYAQSPLNEYVALGGDISAISFHEDQQLLPREKLLTVLERSLVSIVNDVGVDINKAAMDPYYRHHLPFIAGLGPRKAQAMLKKIAQLGGTVLNREQFVTESLMTQQIFINASGFLKISQDDYEDMGKNSKSYDANRRQDPLDATRVHPEDYDLARKMAAGALEYDEDDTLNEHPSIAVAALMNEDNAQASLDQLGLDEFAQNLFESNEDRKRYTLDLIHDELLNPFGELRDDFPLMDDWDIITMLTGETKRTLIPGRVVTASVARIGKDQVIARFDNGLEGSIKREHLTATGEECNSVVKLRQSIQAVIIKVGMHPGPRVSIEMASRADAIQQADHERRNRFDDFYHRDAAKQAQELQERKQRNEANQTRRIIKHPAFRNFNLKEAEAWLAPLQHGDAVIRPSSKGPDHLAVTWKVADGVFQHIDVVELSSDPSQSGGSQFMVDPQHIYSDLDDLLVNHVKSMSRKVDDLMSSEKYKGGTNQDLNNWLTNFVKMNPNRSSYAFGLNRQKAGFFNLSFLANIDSPVQTWQVKVTPTSYRLGEVEVGSVPDLCDAFKRKHQKDVRTMANGGKTPYGAGRATPRVPTGVTPGYGTGAYGRTPQLATQQHVPRTPAYMLGATPNPHRLPPGMPAPIPMPMQLGGGGAGRPPMPAPSMVPPHMQMQMPMQMAPPPGLPMSMPPPQQAPLSNPNQAPAGMNPERWRQIQASQGSGTPAGGGRSGW